MSEEVKSVKIEDLKEDMILGQDIIGPGGMVYLSRGVRLKEPLEKVRSIIYNQGEDSIKIIVEEVPKEIDPSVLEYSDEKIINKDLLKEKLKQDIDKEELQKSNKAIKRSDKERTERETFFAKHSKNKRNLINKIDGLIKGKDVKEEDLLENVNETIKIFETDENIFQLMNMLKDLGDITFGHCQNIALTSYSIGKWLGLNKIDLQELVLTALLTDIGKLKIEKSLLEKKEEISETELEELKNHVVHSYDIIKDYEFLSDRVKLGVLYHHERMDGSGYPEGLKGEDIPLFSRIIAIADLYSAITTKRPYREEKTPFEAINIIKEEYIEKLDTEIWYIFIKKISESFVGQWVILNDEKRGKIIFTQPRDVTRPILDVGGDIIDLAKARHLYIKRFI